MSQPIRSTSRAQRLTFAAALSALVLTAAAKPSMAQTTIAAGSDIWVTVSGGGQTYQDFADNPIPADFFGAGSEPFTGRIEFVGVPIGDTGVFGDTDTVIQRTEDAALNGVGSEATVAIELVVLNLAGSEPITVVVNGQETQWYVYVESYVGGTPITPGSMTIRQTSADGGTFDSTLPVVPMFTFISAANESTIILNGQDYGMELQFVSSGVPWLLTTRAARSRPSTPTNRWPIFRA